MSRFLLFIIGIVAGWFLKDSNWQEWLEKLKAYFAPNEAPPKPIALPKAKEESVEEAVSKADEVFSDPLEKIKGIGPAIKGKLNEHGVFTFAQLAALTPESLEEMVGAQIRRLAKTEEIIAQAKELSE